MEIQAEEQMKNETFLILVNYINSLFKEDLDFKKTETVLGMEDITKFSYKIMPKIEKWIVEKMSGKQQDMLALESPFELFNLVQDTGAGNFLTEDAKDELWKEFQMQQMEEQKARMQQMQAMRQQRGMGGPGPQMN